MELCVTPHTGCGTSLRFSLSLSLSPPLPICVLARTHSCTLSLSLKKKEKMSEEQQNKYRARVGLVLGFGGLDFPCFLSNRAFTRMWKLSVCFLMWYLDRSSPIVGLNTYFNLRNLVWEALLSPFSWWGNWSTGKEKKNHFPQITESRAKGLEIQSLLWPVRYPWSFFLSCSHHLHTGEFGLWCTQRES